MHVLIRTHTVKQPQTSCEAALRMLDGRWHGRRPADDEQFKRFLITVSAALCFAGKPRGRGLLQMAAIAKMGGPLDTGSHDGAVSYEPNQLLLAQKPMTGARPAQKGLSGFRCWLWNSDIGS